MTTRALRRPVRPSPMALAAAALIAAAVAGASALAAPAAGPEAALLQDSEIVVNLAIEGTESAEGLAAFDATVRFDPAVVAVEGVAPGDALPEGSDWLDPVPDGDDGVFFGSYHEGDGPPGRDGTLATLTFRVLGSGAANIRLDRSASGAYDASGGSIVPPARMALVGLPVAPIYLPVGRR